MPLTEDRLAKLELLLDQGDLLVDIAQRSKERRARQGKASGEVRKNSWTIEEARLHGLDNSLRSCLLAHENSKRVYDAAKREYDRTLADVAMVRQARAVYLIALKAQSGEVVDVDELAPGGSVMDVGELAPNGGGEGV